MTRLAVDNFKSKLINGGARTNLFQVTPSFPSFVDANTELASILCKAASLPASTITPIEVKFRGRTLKVSGERTFEPWTITIINDSNMEVRDAFETWSNGINSHEGNISMSTLDDYQVDMQISQLDSQGVPVKEYNLIGCWPSSVSAIEMSYDTSEISEFQVTLEFQYWTSNTTS
jgi:hypothetical protein